MSISEDFRLDRLERQEARDARPDLRKQLTLLASAVSEVNGRIDEVNVMLPEGARRVAPIAWRPDPSNKHIARARKWRVTMLDRLIDNVKVSIETADWRLNYLQRHLDADGGAGVDAAEADLQAREIRVVIRDIDDIGTQINSRPKLGDWVVAHATEILGGSMAVTVGLILALIAVS